jgi:hypothetical protein
VIERVSWETCPRCGHATAVAWVDGRPVEVDCPRGCRLSPNDFLREAPLTRNRTSSLSRWSATVRRWR